MNLMIIAYINILVGFIPVAIGLRRWKRLGPGMTALWVYVAIGAVAELAGYIMASHNIRNLWMLHCFTLFEFICLNVAMGVWLRGESRIPGLLKIITVAYLPVWIVVNATIEPFGVPDTIMTTASSVYFMVLTIVILIHGILHPGVQGMMPWPRFWGAAAIFVYFLGSVPMFTLAGELVKLYKLQVISFMTIHWSISILVDVLYSLALGVPEAS